MGHIYIPQLPVQSVTGQVRWGCLWRWWWRWRCTIRWSCKVKVVVDEELEELKLYKKVEEEVELQEEVEEEVEL